MVPETNNHNKENETPLTPGEVDRRDDLKDASTSDAAAGNARESERIQEASRAAVPAYQIDTEKLERDDEGRRDREKAEKEAHDRPLTTEGSQEEIEENLSGSTNLTLDQLKKERDPGGFSLEGEEPENREF